MKTRHSPYFTMYKLPPTQCIRFPLQNISDLQRFDHRPFTVATDGQKGYSVQIPNRIRPVIPTYTIITKEYPLVPINLIPANSIQKEQLDWCYSQNVNNQ